MPSYQELKAQLETLAEKTESARLAEMASVIEQVRQLVATWGLTEKDVFGGRAARAGRWLAGNGAVDGRVHAHVLGRVDGRSVPMPPKYRDPKTGATWTGRGRAPRWLDGKKRERFLIAEE